MPYFKLGANVYLQAIISWTKMAAPRAEHMRSTFFSFLTDPHSTTSHDMHLGTILKLSNEMKLFSDEVTLLMFVLFHWRSQFEKVAKYGHDKDVHKLSSN